MKYYLRTTPITASWSPEEVQRKLIRIQNSSNVWAYAYNGEDEPGTLYLQFKGAHGGPDDIYMYYDVPSKVYRKFIVAPSKGHFFHVNIRNRYKYRKLTGDKRGKLPNAVW